MDVSILTTSLRPTFNVTLVSNTMKLVTYMGYFLYIKYKFLICFIFSLPLKFGPTVLSSGMSYLVIWFLFIRSSGFGLMDPTLEYAFVGLFLKGTQK